MYETRACRRSPSLGRDRACLCCTCGACMCGLVAWGLPGSVSEWPRTVTINDHTYARAFPRSGLPIHCRCTLTFGPPCRGFSLSFFCNHFAHPLVCKLFWNGGSLIMRTEDHGTGVAKNHWCCVDSASHVHSTSYVTVNRRAVAQLQKIVVFKQTGIQNMWCSGRQSGRTSKFAITSAEN